MKRLVLVVAIALGLVVPQTGFAAPDGADGDVTAISVIPGPGSALVIVDVNGSVEIKDFLLGNPARLVVDVIGAQLRAPGVVYDGANRGGIVNVRYSQFRSDVVRVVLELESIREYGLEYRDGSVRIELHTDQQFQAWSSGQLARTLLEEPADIEPTPVASAEQPVQQSQMPRITVSWDSVPMVDVIAGFAAFGGRSIIMGQDIDLIVSGEMINQPWDVALAEVLDANGLRAEERPSGVIVVQRPGAEAARDSLEPKQTVVVPVSFKTAASLAAVLQPMVLPRGGTVVADTSTNQLIITDSRNRIAGDIELAGQLDVPTPQVSIQAKLVFVDRTDIEELGVQYDLGNQDQFFNKLVQRPDPSSSEAVDTDGDGVPDAIVATEFFEQNTNVIDLGGNSLSAIGNADAIIPSNALELIFSTAIGNFNLTTFVQALEQVELADLQAEPLIATSDHTPARILVGERTPIRIVDLGSQQQGAAGGGQVQPVATVDFVETGIGLEVTPHVTGSGQVLLQIHAENSSIREAAGADLGFTFQTQEADAQILVDDGETAVIGGLTVTSVTVAKSGIPFLVDLPIVGNIFGFTSRREQRRDLLILVTPHITQSPGQNR